MTENEADIYIIPHNFTDNGKILGFIEKVSLYTAAAWFIPTTAADFYLLPCSIDVKLFILVLVIFPPAILALIGIGGDTVIDFIRYVFEYWNNARVYYYEK